MKYIKVNSNVKCTPDRFAMSQRVARLKRVLRENQKGDQIMTKVTNNSDRGESIKKMELSKGISDRGSKKIKLQRIRQKIEIITYAVITVGLLIAVDYALFIKGV